MLTPTALPTPYPATNRPARAPAKCADKPADRDAKTARGQQGGARRCAWCGCHLKRQLAANAKRLTCSHSCRSSLSRFKKKTCAALLTTALGLPKPKADELLQRFGLPEVEVRLALLGWRWHPERKAWAQDAPEGKAAA